MNPDKNISFPYPTDCLTQWVGPRALGYPGQPRCTEAWDLFKSGADKYAVPWEAPQCIHLVQRPMRPHHSQCPQRNLSLLLSSLLLSSHISVCLYFLSPSSIDPCCRLWRDLHLPHGDTEFAQLPQQLPQPPGVCVQDRGGGQHADQAQLHPL